MSSKTSSQISSKKENLIKEYNLNLLNILSESSTVIFRKIYDEKGKEIPYLELISIDTPKPIPKRDTHLENENEKYFQKKLDENAKSKEIWIPLEQKSMKNWNHKKGIITTEENDRGDDIQIIPIILEESDSEDDIQIMKESKFLEARGKYYCYKDKNIGILKKEDKKDPKRKNMGALPNGNEKGTIEEKDIYSLKSQNINDGSDISGKTSSRSKENERGEKFLKLYSWTGSNNDKNDNFLGKKRKKNKSHIQSSFIDMEIIELSEDEENSDNKKVLLHNNAQAFATGNKSSHFPVSKNNAIVNKIEGSECIIEIDDSSILSKSQEFKSLKEKKNKDEEEYQCRIEETMNRIDEKKNVLALTTIKQKMGTFTNIDYAN